MFGEGAGNSRGMIPRCMEEVFAQLDRKAKVSPERIVFGANRAEDRPLPRRWVYRLLDLCAIACLFRGVRWRQRGTCVSLVTGDDHTIRSEQAAHVSSNDTSTF